MSTDIERLVVTSPAVTTKNLALKQSITMPIKSKSSNKSFQKHAGRKLFTKSMEKNEKKIVSVEGI